MSHTLWPISSGYDIHVCKWRKFVLNRKMIETFTHKWFFYNKSILFAFILKKFCVFLDTFFHILFFTLCLQFWLFRIRRIWISWFVRLGQNLLFSKIWNNFLFYIRSCAVVLCFDLFVSCGPNANLACDFSSFFCLIHACHGCTPSIIVI